MAARTPDTTELTTFPEPLLSNPYSSCFMTSIPLPNDLPHSVTQKYPLLTYQTPFHSTSSSSYGLSDWQMKVGEVENNCFLKDKAYKTDKTLVTAKTEVNHVSRKCFSFEINEESSKTDNSYLCKDKNTNFLIKGEGKVDPEKKTLVSSLQSDGDSDLENNQMHKDLPEELLLQFSAHRCELCLSQMNSLPQSRMHYNGKQHQKKVKLYMENWYKEHGDPNAKKMRKDYSVGPPKIPDDKRLYCECCDLSFTSILHAQQHYAGRNHQRVLSGQQPLRSGYFNKSTNKWQRFPPQDEIPSVGHGIIQSPDLPIPENLMPGNNEKNDDSKKGRFFCDLCNIGATSQEQLDMHFKGGKHKKAVKTMAQNEKFDDDFDIDSDSCKEPPTDSILASVIKTKEGTSQKKSKAKDYSIYRTPSGRFYCQPCNTTVNCESQFIQHLDSKKHKFLMGQKKGGNRIPKSRKGPSNSKKNEGLSFLQSISSANPSIAVPEEDNQGSCSSEA